MITVQKYSRGLLLVSFIEGGSLMAVELLSAKLIAPFYGASLYVWAAVLTVTLLGITAGYALGGKLSKHPAVKRYLFTVLIVSAAFVLLMPYSAHWIMSSTVNALDVIPGSLVTSLIVLFPPIFLFGMVSPMLVQHLAATLDPGKAAGALYGVSTLGGIAATMFVGFYSIPEIGIRESCFLFGGLMIFSALLYGGIIKLAAK
jgi:hypothetical protein